MARLDRPVVRLRHGLLVTLYVESGLLAYGIDVIERLLHVDFTWHVGDSQRGMADFLRRDRFLAKQ